MVRTGAKFGKPASPSEEKLMKPDLPPFEEVCAQFQPLFLNMLKKYGREPIREDLLQAGRMGLWEAYCKYDPAKGPFPSFAARYVRGRILQELHRQWGLGEVPMSTLVREEEEREAPAFPDPQSGERFSQVETLDLAERLGQMLSPRERIILEEHLLLGESLADLARRHGVSVETAKTWKKRAVKKMRAACPPQED